MGGAMENWGLVTYREVCIFCDEKTVSSTQKQRICSVVAHELAHQWFGNLVTMGWWDDLWLNEGFANWMQTYCTDFLHPEWNIWETYVAMEQQQALSLDGLRSSHPIQVPIAKAQEVEEVFDAISYCKGGSVVRMIYAVIGKEKFQEGLRAYFQKHRYSNTETSDLWAAWSASSGKAIDTMMGSWTSQMGFPVVKVLADPAEAGGDIELAQSWFLADGSSEPDDAKKTWTVPVLVGTDKGAAPVVFMEPTKQSKVSCTADLKSAEWVKLNFGQHTPTRVMYPAAMLRKLIKALPQLAAEDKIGLISDGFALSKAGLQDPMLLVELLRGFAGEMNDKVWSELGSKIGALDGVVRQGLDVATGDAFSAFAAKLVKPAFDQVGWDSAEGDSDNTKKLRSTLLSLVSKYLATDEAVSAEAMKRIEAFFNAPNDSAALNADIRPAVFSVAIKSGGEKMMNRLMDVHSSLEDAACKIHVYQAIADAPTTELRLKVLKWVNSDAVRAQDLIYTPTLMSRSGKAGAEDVFGWVQSDFDTIHARLGATSMILFSHVVRFSGAGFVTNERADEVLNFWKSKDKVYSVVSKAVDQTCEGIRANSQFVERLRASEVAKASSWA